MSETTFTIIKQCEHCGILFEAQKRTTRYCSHICNSRNYKLKKRQELIKQTQAVTFQKVEQKIKPSAKALDIELIKKKNFLSVTETAKLFGCSPKTIYRMIENKQLNAINISQRMTRIRREDIEKLFEVTKQEKTQDLTPEQCYTMKEITEKYNISRNTIYGFNRKYTIEKIMTNGITLYSKVDIDNIFIAP